MNAASSRSHAVFTLLLRRAGAGDGDRVAKFRLVDLAGSERNKRSQAEGTRFKARDPIFSAGEPYVCLVGPGQLGAQGSQAEDACVSARKHLHRHN